MRVFALGLATPLDDPGVAGDDEGVIVIGVIVVVLIRARDGDVGGSRAPSRDCGSLLIIYLLAIIPLLESIGAFDITQAVSMSYRSRLVRGERVK